MSLANSLRRFQTIAARTRAECWPVSFTLSTDTAARTLKGSGSPPARTRMPDENRTGYIVRTTRVIAVLRSTLASLGGTPPTIALGTEFTITADEINPANVGTVWRSFDLKDSDGGSEIRAVCFRLDN